MVEKWGKKGREDRLGLLNWRALNTGLRNTSQKK